MSRRVRLIGLAIAFALLANGVANHAFAGFGIHHKVTACSPVQQVPACQPVKPLTLPEVCKPVKPLPPPPACTPVKACEPVKAVPACKPVKACDQVDTHGKHVVLQERVTWFAWRLKRHTPASVVYEDNSLPTTSAKTPTPSPAPKPPTI